MSKPVTFLVTDIEGEVTIHDEASLSAVGLTPEEADTCFAGVGYWLTINMKRSTFADQQQATRDSEGDDTLLPQKRFALAVESIERRTCGAEEKSLPAVTEKWFSDLEPPALGNAVNIAVVNAWYPAASKTAFFFKKWQEKQAESAKASGSA